MNDKGQAAEQAAADFLTAQGLRIVSRNWRCRFGEIDLICQDGNALVFVEVRSRSSSRFGGAAASISASKQAKLVATAECYLATLKKVPACRFDAVLLDGEGTLDWVKNIICAP